MEAIADYLGETPKYTRGRTTLGQKYVGRPRASPDCVQMCLRHLCRILTGVLLLVNSWIVAYSGCPDSARAEELCGPRKPIRSSRCERLTKDSAPIARPVIFLAQRELLYVGQMQEKAIEFLRRLWRWLPADLRDINFGWTRLGDADAESSNWVAGRERRCSESPPVSGESRGSRSAQPRGEE